jgi:hypothetical protein
MPQSEGVGGGKGRRRGATSSGVCRHGATAARSLVIQPPPHGPLASAAARLHRGTACMLAGGKAPRGTASPCGGGAVRSLGGGVGSAVVEAAVAEAAAAPSPRSMEVENASGTNGGDKRDLCVGPCWSDGKRGLCGWINYSLLELSLYRRLIVKNDDPSVHVISGRYRSSHTVWLGRCGATAARQQASGSHVAVIVRMRGNAW